MKISFAQITLDLSFHSLDIQVGDREWFFRRQPHQPLGFFSRLTDGHHPGAAVEVWGLGWYGCWNRA